MHEAFYPLSGPPFRLIPDHRFFYGSDSHRKGLSYLRYGLHQGEGFIVITGNVGTGKSMLVSQLFAELDRTRIVPAQLVTSNIDADDVVRLIVAAFGIRPTATDKAALLGSLEQFLLEQHRAGRRVLLVVDEAQNLPLQTLEELRMLSNFSVDGQPLFQSFLIGQPQFKDLLADPSLEQLRQRVIASHHLEPLTPDETRAYIEHRLQTVGWTGNPAITPGVYARIADETGGVPRRINILCSRLLLYGALEELTTLDEAAIEAVLADLQEEVASSAFPTLTDRRLGAGRSDGGASRAGRRISFRHRSNGADDPPPTDLMARLETLETRVQSVERTLRQLLQTALGLMSGAPRAPAVTDEEPPHDRHQ